MQEIHFKTWVLAVLLLAASLFFIKLGDRSLFGSEGRWSEVTREMRLTENYFWPTINGRVYYDKPLLSYWLITAVAGLSGDVRRSCVSTTERLGRPVGYRTLDGSYPAAL